MFKKSVLAVGIDPAFLDAAAMGGFTPELVRAYIDGELQRVRALGYDVDSCLIPADEGAAMRVERALRARTFDCIVIGAGLREPSERLILFEKIVNLIHELAPRSRIAFNTSPGDTVEAVQRWV